MKTGNILKLRKFISNNSPSLLTGLSVAGLITVVIMAVRATPKALRILEEEALYRETRSDEETDNVPITKFEAIKLVWTCYIPAAVMGGVTIACIIGANTISLKRTAALASVYSLAKETLNEYQTRVIETIGENKHVKIKDEIAKAKIDKNPLNNNTVIVTGKGDTLCYDSISGRYFKSDIEKIRKVQNELNKDLMSEMSISLNDAYYALGLSNIKLGEDLGWSIDDGLMEFDFSSQLSEDGVPCLVIDYCVDPLYDYCKRH